MNLKKELSVILTLTQSYFLEKGSWPGQAAELQAFAGQLGRPLDFSGFHRLRFEKNAPEELVLEYWLSPKGWDFSPRGRVILTARAEGFQTCADVPIKIIHQKLPPEKIEVRSFCSVWEPAGISK